MIKELKIADMFTLGSLICGLLSIIASLELNFKLAILFMFASGILDFLDGAIARLLNQQNKMGMELDSLSDIIAFGAAPVVFVAKNGFTDTISLVILSLYLAAGTIRLAYYNINAEKNKGFFIGMPITANALIIPLAYLLLPKLGWLIWIVLLSAVAMVSPFRLKKIKF